MSDREINLRSVLFLVIGILLLLSLVICVFIVGSESDLVPVEATVINSKKAEDGTEKYDITLEYEVDGKTYRYNYQDKEGLEIDKSIGLYYHSKNVTSVRPNKTSKLIFICPLIGLIICIIGLVELFKKNNREPKVDYQTSVIGVIGDTKQLKVITEDAPVHQYEKTPEELAETQVKSIKKETDDTATEDRLARDLAFESINDTENEIQTEMADSEEKVEENNLEEETEINDVQVHQDIFVPKAAVIQNIPRFERKVEMPEVVSTPVKVEEDIVDVEQPEEENVNVGQYDKVEEMVNDESQVIQDESVWEGVNTEEKSSEEEQTVPEENVEEQVEEKEKPQEEHSSAFQQLMEKVNQIQVEEQQKAEEESKNVYETQTIPVEEIKQASETDDDYSNEETEENEEEQNDAKDNNLDDDDIKKMIKNALKEVAVEKKEEKKETGPVVQKRVLPNYFYISGNSLIYEEPGKEAKELDLKTVKDVVRTINSEDKVVKIVVSNEEVKCILTNMKNIDLEQVAKLLLNKMSIIDKNFKEVIEHKEY